MKPTTPKPVVVTTICSECGLAWEAHGDKPTTSDCIRLLKAELAKRPTPITITYPYVQPVYPSYPWYQYTWTNGVQSTGNITPINCAATNTANYQTPAIEATCTAISA